MTLYCVRYVLLQAFPVFSFKGAIYHHRNTSSCLKNVVKHIRNCGLLNTCFDSDCIRPFGVKNYLAFVWKVLYCLQYDLWHLTFSHQSSHLLSTCCSFIYPATVLRSWREAMSCHVMSQGISAATSNNKQTHHASFSQLTTNNRKYHKCKLSTNWL